MRACETKSVNINLFKKLYICYDFIFIVSFYNGLIKFGLT
ncbi:hypothetical protein MCSV2_60068 [Mucispirillum schaedleri ASF457]|nr:hypothetical protein MCSV2_60068 [Mucispirillum schaedleri ASF457]